MTGYMFALPLELLVGSIAGFYFSDKQKKANRIELLIAGMFYLLVNIFVIWQYPDMSIGLWAQLTICWVMLTLGTILGKALRTRVIDVLTAKSVDKHSTQRKLDQFIRYTNGVAFNYNNQAISTDSLLAIVGEIKRLREHAIKIGESKLIYRMDLILDSCYSLSRLSGAIRDTEGENDEEVERYKKASAELRDIAWSTLNQIEQRTYVKLHQHAHKSVLLMVRLISVK